MIVANQAISESQPASLTSPVISSKALWSDFLLQYYHWPAGQSLRQTMDSHTLMINLGAPAGITWKCKDSWNKGYTLTGNVIALIPAGTSIDMEWDDELNVLYLSFGPVFIDRLLESENFRFIERYNFEETFLRDLALKIYGEMSAGSFIEKVYLENLITSCLLHLAIEYPLNQKKLFAPKGKLSASQLKQVIDYAHEFVHSNISLAELASTVHLSPFHFSRLFRHTTGLSPYQFVLQMKIDYAKKLMRTRRDSLSEVAYTLNFTDQAHFSNVFKKFTGVCPRKFLSNSAA